MGKRQTGVGVARGQSRCASSQMGVEWHGDPYNIPGFVGGGMPGSLRKAGGGENNTCLAMESWMNGSISQRCISATWKQGGTSPRAVLSSLLLPWGLMTSAAS